MPQEDTYGVTAATLLSVSLTSVGALVPGRGLTLRGEVSGSNQALARGPPAIRGPPARV